MGRLRQERARRTRLLPNKRDKCGQGSPGAVCSRGLCQPHCQVWPAPLPSGASPTARVPRPPKSPLGAPSKNATINRAQPSSGRWRWMRTRKQMGAGGRGCPQISHPNLVSNARAALGISEDGDPRGEPQLPLSGSGCSCSPIAAAPPPSAFLLEKHPVGRWVHPTPRRDFSLNNTSDSTGARAVKPQPVGTATNPDYLFRLGFANKSLVMSGKSGGKLVPGGICTSTR